MYICQQKASRAAEALLEHFGPFTGLSFAVAYTTASEPALGSWETFCRDKLTLSSGVWVSLNVNLLPLPYLVVSLSQLIPAD